MKNIFYSGFMVSESFSNKLKELGSNMKSHHCTVMYSEKMPVGKIHNLIERFTVPITEIRHWPGADGVGYTVAILDSGMLHDWYSYFISLGCEYDFEYIPHITLEKGNGDTSEKYKSLIGQWVIFDYQYVQILQR